MGVAIAGRETPFNLPILSNADAMVAPVFPALTQALHSEFFTDSIASLMEEFFLDLITLDGLSLLEIYSGV